MMHLHIYADEVFILVSGRVESVMVAPNNTIYTHSLVAGDNVVYPKGRYSRERGSCDDK